MRQRGESLKDYRARKKEYNDFYTDRGISPIGTADRDKDGILVPPRPIHHNVIDDEALPVPMTTLSYIAKGVAILLSVILGATLWELYR